MIAVNTKNILFICGGAFDGIEKKIAHDSIHVWWVTLPSSDKANIDRNNLLKYITPLDLKSFGLIPEIIGDCPSSPIWSHWTEMPYCAFWWSRRIPSSNNIRNCSKWMA